MHAKSLGKIFKGAPYGNKNAAGPHRRNGGVAPSINSAKVARLHVASQMVVDRMPPPSPPPRGEEVRQVGVKTVDDLFSSAMKAKPDFDSKIGAVIKEAGASSVVSSSKEDYDAIIEGFAKGTAKGPVMVIGGIKSKSRVAEKVGDYTELKDGTPPIAQVGDILRATLAVDRVDDIPKGLKMLEHAGIHLGRDPKVRLGEPVGAGYRDVLLSVKLATGHIAEIQVNTKTMLVAKEKAHVLYEKERSIKGLADKEKRPMTKAEATRVAALQSRQSLIYSEAWVASGG